MGRGKGGVNGGRPRSPRRRAERSQKAAAHRIGAGWVWRRDGRSRSDLSRVIAQDPEAVPSGSPSGDTFSGRVWRGGAGRSLVGDSRVEIGILLKYLDREQFL